VELGSSVSTVAKLRDGRPGFDPRQGQGFFLFVTASRPALEPIQPAIQWAPGDLSAGVKRPERESNYSLPSSAEVKNSWSSTSTPYKKSSWRDA
jgi:hypothetical protein